jgi:hypothetical protein
MGYNLSAAGFKEVHDNPKEGDIAVIQPIPGHPSGHTCIYNGAGIWYSDFVQRTMYPGLGYRKIHPAFKIYRHY